MLLLREADFGAAELETLPLCLSTQYDKYPLKKSNSNKGYSPAGALQELHHLEFQLCLFLS